MWGAGRLATHAVGLHQGTPNLGGDQKLASENSRLHDPFGPLVVSAGQTHSGAKQVGAQINCTFCNCPEVRTRSIVEATGYTKHPKNQKSNLARLPDGTVNESG
ncbi:hypothetical protein FKM82_029003 [Ascaphus truei]